MTDNIQKIPHKALVKGRKLGEGGFGIVFEGKWKEQDVAIKALKMTMLSPEEKEEFTREARAMARLNHPQIIKLHGICIEPGHYALVIALMPKGDLYNLLRNKQNTLLWNTRWELAIDIGAGLAYLHQMKILHRDLKSLNILLDHNLKAKITDFGLAKIRLHSQSIYTKNVAGSIPWMAPELFKRGGKIKVSEAADIYAYGMVLWEIASRKIPFSDAVNPNVIPTWVMNGERENIPNDCPNSYAKVIQLCWKGAPEDRPTATSALQQLRLGQEQGSGDYKNGNEFYQTGLYTKALPFFQLAAKAAYYPAYIRLHHLYQKKEVMNLKNFGEPGIDTWTDKAEKVIAWFQQEAKKGGAEAQFNLGYCHAHGIGIDKSEAQAITFYTIAAEQGLPHAQYELALCYDHGKGTKTNPSKAATYYKMAADAGHISAQFNLGYSYMHGEGVKQDYVLGAKYYKMAANQGDADAQYNLGLCFDSGLGVGFNRGAAFKYYKLAADQGHANAQYNTGFGYEHGQGVNANLSKAKEYFIKAGEQGLYKAALKAKEIEKIIESRYSNVTKLMPPDEESESRGGCTVM